MAIGVILCLLFGGIIIVSGTFIGLTFLCDKEIRSGVIFIVSTLLLSIIFILGAVFCSNIKVSAITLKAQQLSFNSNIQKEV